VPSGVDGSTPTIPATPQFRGGLWVHGATTDSLFFAVDVPPGATVSVTALDRTGTEVFRLGSTVYVSVDGLDPIALRLATITVIATVDGRLSRPLVLNIDQFT
jgi:hypothetical protein